MKVAILPLVKKFSGEAQSLFDRLAPHFMCEYSESGTIGKRYHRMDALGVPFSIAVEPENYEK